MNKKEIERREEKVYTEREQLKAAYALNMCTVSVSQIVEYNDSYILDQEYDAILNNLNLEQMPKDEALLTILTELLNVITFFKIQNLRKEMIEKDYQDKMKNAIWSAVPNLGMIVAGGNLITAGISLATQVGMGYMNYRKEKANANNEKYKQEMELQITALEQFNALKRELFTTAWRLAAEYKFPDQYRLTEKQITQYNSILLDQNELRKYDRLESIQNNFHAYPPFWYHFGHTASYIAGNDGLMLTEETKAFYRQKAKEHFAKYKELNKFNILREDQLAASFALEYIDLLLLDEKYNRTEIEELLAIAVKNAGNSNDLLELCAISYLKIGRMHEAADLFKNLVNEEYNTIVNAKLLSNICVSQYISSTDCICKFSNACEFIEECDLREPTDIGESNKNRYEAMYNTLALRVNPEYLLPMPTKEFKYSNLSDEELMAQLTDEFMEKQKLIIKQNYRNAFTQFIKKSKIEFNKVLPLPTINHYESDDYFLDNRKARNQRKDDVKRALGDEYYKQEYLEKLKNVGFRFRYIDVLNKSISALDTLTMFHEYSDKHLVRQKVKQLVEEMNDIQDKLDNSSFNVEDYKKMQNKLLYDCFMGGYIDRLRDGALDKIDSFNTMKELDDAELLLNQFCIDQKIEIYKSIQVFNGAKDNATREKKYLGYDFFKEAEKEETRLEQYQRMQQLIKDKAHELIKPKAFNVDVVTSGSPEFEAYFRNEKLSSNMNRAEIIAILKDKNGNDFVFRRTGFSIIKNNTVQKEGNYRELKYSKAGKKECLYTNEFWIKHIDLIPKSVKYSPEGIHIGRLANLTASLADLVEEYKL